MSEGAAPSRPPLQEEPLHSTEPSTSVPGAAVFTAPQSFPVRSGSTLDTPVGMAPPTAVGVSNLQSRSSIATNTALPTLAADAASRERPLASAPPDPAALLRDVEVVRNLLASGWPSRPQLAVDVPAIILLIARDVAPETIAETIAQRISDEMAALHWLQPLRVLRVLANSLLSPSTLRTTTPSMLFRLLHS